MATVAEGEIFSLSPDSDASEPVFITIDELVLGIDTQLMLDNIYYLSDDIGIRAAGSENEILAQNYIASTLESYGYLAQVSEPIPLHNGLTSRNVWAELPGVNAEIILIGAHYDSKPPSPGASDNGTGVAVVLELARTMVEIVPPYTIRFVFFGAEEIIDGNSDHHHYGSRFLAEDAELRERLHSMTSVDMVGVGTALWIDNMRFADDGWRSHLYSVGSELGYPVMTGETRSWSDHEAFEFKGVPVAWVHWRYDSNYHQATDTPDRIDPGLLAMTTELMLRGILGIDGDTSVQCTDSGNLFAF